MVSPSSVWLAKRLAMNVIKYFDKNAEYLYSSFCLHMMKNYMTTFTLTTNSEILKELQLKCY